METGRCLGVSFLESPPHATPGQLGMMGQRTLHFKGQALQGSVEESFITGDLKEG